MDKLDDILQRYVADGDNTKDKMLGAAFVAVHKGEVVYSGSAGKIGFDVGAKDFTSDTFTWVASMTKLITVTCVMQLVEKGILDLDSDVRQIVPELNALQLLQGFSDDGKPILKDNSDIITLRILLSHTAGFAYDTGDKDLERWAAATSRKVNHLAFSIEGFTTPLKFQPGQGWTYGTGIDWAGIVLEKVTGQTLGTYMQENIFDPLGMKDTGFWPEKLPHTESRTAKSTLRLEDGTLMPFQVPLPIAHELEGGGAGLYTTTNDYARFICAYLQGRLLSDAMVNEMFTPQLNEKQRTMLETIAYDPELQSQYAPEFPVGLGIDSGLGGLINLHDVPGKRRQGSLMWTGVCNSRWWIDRKTGIAGVMFVTCLPWGEPVNGKLYDELERATYGALHVEG